MAEHRIPIDAKEEVAADTLALWFDISDRDFDYREGQHAEFELIDPPSTGDKGPERIFSFASASGRDRFMIATRVRDTAFKRRLEEIPVGKAIRVDGPGGDLVLHEDGSRPAILLAGGIGITPFRAILERAAIDDDDRPLRLFYSNRTPESAAFLDELREWESDNPGLEVVATITRPEESEADGDGRTGRIDESVLRERLGEEGLEQGVFYVAGPKGFLEGMRELLDGMGVDGPRIKTERFYGY